MYLISHIFGADILQLKKNSLPNTFTGDRLPGANVSMSEPLVNGWL